MDTNQQRIEEAYKVVEAFGNLRLSMHHAGKVIASGIALGMASSIALGIRPAWVRRRDQVLAKMEKARGRSDDSTRTLN